MKNKYSILVAEQNKELHQMLGHLFKEQGYRVRDAFSAKECVSMILDNCLDLIVVDTDELEITGEQLLQSIRHVSDCLVILISSKSGVKDKVKMLELGADDYLTKPFSPEELVARIHTCLRRKRVETKASYYENAKLRIDFAARTVFYDGKEIHVTPVEYRILEYLAVHAGEVVTYHEILNKIWGPYYKSSDNRILRVNMANIRRKFGMSAQNRNCIVTEAGVGYRMVPVAVAS